LNLEKAVEDVARRSSVLKINVFLAFFK